MNKWLAFLLVLLGGLQSGTAQIPPTYSSADIYMQLKKLNVLGSILYIAAHPDDENNGFLPYLAKDRLYRTAYLSLTRGDGGQNLMGSEQGIELGMIRTQELLAARKIDGAEQYFTTAYEFGFSKNSEEALRVWDREKVLSDVVWIIRQFQPDVIITRFPGDARAGHGHHSASSIIANEAFKAAADPARFPEQFKRGVKPWQAKRILWNGLNFSGGNSNAPLGAGQLRIDVGGYNPLIGKSYGELGGEARSMHKSQAEGRPRRRGPAYESFETTGGAIPKSDLMDDVVTDWNRLDGGKEIQALINEIIAGYQFTNPEASVPALCNVYKALKKLPESNWTVQKLKELQGLIENCAGLFVEATTQQEAALRGDTLRVNCAVNARSQVKATIKRVSVDYGVDSLTNIHTEINQNYNFSMTIVPTMDPMSTQPYWLVKPRINEGMFEVKDENMIGKAWNDPSLEATVAIEIENITFYIKRPVQYKYVDPAKGELYQPFIIAPHVQLYMSPNVALLNVRDVQGNLRSDSLIHVNYSSNFTARNVPVTLYVMQDKVHRMFTDQPRDFEKGKTYTIDVPVGKVYNPEKGNAIGSALLIKPDKKMIDITDYFKSIEYDHIPNIHYYFKDNVKVVKEAIKVVGKRIGFIPGSGDEMPDALKQMGYEVKLLDDGDLNDETLKQFDAIITGVRAYNMLGYLTNKYDVLMRYVQQGGNLIVQYNRNNQVGSARAKIGPYPFQISSGSRVTEEDAKVNFLLPMHPVLNYPNKITELDFKDWVQERSTYQAEQLDPHYEAPLGMNDTGERQSNGSLITTKYGKGNFSYVSLVLFRQLPAGRPGAYRLLANLIALSKNN